MRRTREDYDERAVPRAYAEGLVVVGEPAAGQLGWWSEREAARRRRQHLACGARLYGCDEGGVAKWFGGEVVRMLGGNDEVAEA